MLFYTRLDFEDLDFVGDFAGLSLSSSNIISTLERKKRMMGQVKKSMSHFALNKSHIGFDYM